MHANARPRKILAVSSGGGHWVQLRRVVPAFTGHRVVYVTIDPTYRKDVPDEKVYIVNDATRWDRWGSLRLAFSILRILIRERPDAIVSTGAAPGCFAILFGRFLRARTVWIDSIANVESMSLSGMMVRRHADLWLTQWAHLARPEGPEHAGRVF
ncbi:MAG TPA: UDP-N-acetylglucosamine--LPS N-acetylglucosamine transferase [Deltaproteobacteria bacterium]|nr:UDP-N-acetylglucosamine--LPS N-acetylglucosamine transferase [Deltaproteobacteria bacterium]